MIEDQDIFFPSLIGVEDQNDLAFFVSTLNASLSSDFLWLPDSFDFLKANDSLSVMAGGNSAAGVLSGDASKVYVEGLNKVILATSKSLDLKADDGEFSVIYDENQTEDIVINASNSRAQLLNMAEGNLQLEGFRADGEALLYQANNKTITFQLTDDSEIKMFAVDGSEPLTITKDNGQYQIATGQAQQIFVAENGIAFDGLPPTESEPAYETGDQTPDYQIDSDFFSPDDIEIDPGVESIYSDMELLESSLYEQALAQLASQFSSDGINDLISADDDDLIFDPPEQSFILEHVQLQHITDVNQTQLDQVSSINSYSDLVFDDALEFFNEI